MNDFVVMKFGGTSVASADGWQTIARCIGEVLDAGDRPLVVCSALAGVSDLLEGLLPSAVRGRHERALAEIEARHLALATALELDFDVEAALAPARRLAAGVSLTGEHTPRMRARVMASGELTSTRLGAAWLRAQGVEVHWQDARDALRSDAPATDARTFLSAVCDDAADPALAARLVATGGATLTQGFIARDPSGETVLLGRGGSDTSAALFAARLGAVRCEIWTDVPGVYTTNPRDVPEARLLRRLDYDEAQELATAGAKVLHPRCLAPVRRHGIPLHVRCTHRPGLVGTVVGPRADGPAEVKAIAARRGVTLVSMDTLGMWQQVGFLADVFECFRRRGLSVDLVSTSETNVTASVDLAAGATDLEVMEGLLADLGAHCAARAIGPCAAVSLVGRDIRAILHQLGPALSVFEDRQIHLVSQAASDLNLTFVVDEDEADRLVSRLHALLFAGRGADERLGPTWQETFGAPATEAAEPPWWIARRGELLAVESTPAYVYDAASIDRAAAGLLGVGAVDRVFYAMKANDHPGVLRRVAEAGLGVECVSPGELAHAFDAIPGLPAADVLFTPNFAGREEYAGAFERGVHVTVDNLHPLEAWPEVFDGRDVMLRLDPGRGRGHHAKVRTAGRRSKFGIAPEQLDAVTAAVARAGARVVGLHSHVGSGVRDPEAWPEVAMFLADVAERFPDARVLDLGGGLGVREKPGLAPLDLAALDEGLQRFRAARPGFDLWLEPGRYVVAEAGVLLARVTQTKRKGDRAYVGIDAGMHTLLRPALYGAWHEIVNLTRLGEPPTLTADVVGPICETGDTLGHARHLPDTREGDLLLIATAGAYGRTMRSHYNRRPPPLELLV